MEPTPENDNLAKFLVHLNCLHKEGVITEAQKGDLKDRALAGRMDILDEGLKANTHEDRSKLMQHLSVKVFISPPHEAGSQSVAHASENIDDSENEPQDASPLETRIAYAPYIYQVHPDLGISRSAMKIIENFMNDILVRLGTEACRLARYNKTTTLSSKEIQAAAVNILPEPTSVARSARFAKFAVAEGNKAIVKFNAKIGPTEAIDDDLDSEISGEEDEGFLNTLPEDEEEN